MPKLKTNRGTAKRFVKTASGFKRRRAFRNHILTKMSPKAKRQLRSMATVDSHNLAAIKQLLGE